MELLCGIERVNKEISRVVEVLEKDIRAQRREGHAIENIKDSCGGNCALQSVEVRVRRRSERKCG